MSLAITLSLLVKYQQASTIITSALTMLVRYSVEKVVDFSIW